MAYSAQELIRLLSLQPHPEGGWFAFRESSGTSVPVPGFSGERETCSYIYYLLQKGEISRWHRLQAAEVWAWHQGGSLLMTLGGDGEAPAAERTLSASAEEKGISCRGAGRLGPLFCCPLPEKRNSRPVSRLASTWQR